MAAVKSVAVPAARPDLKIFFDARWTRLDTHDGISRYGASLLTALARIHPVTMLIYDRRQLKLLPAGVPYVVVNPPMSPLELLLPSKLNRLGAEVVFSPLQVMGSWGRHFKLILTQQDLIYYDHPKPPTVLPRLVQFLWRQYHRSYAPGRLMLNRADVIATVSHTSKNEIERRRLTHRPVVVVYNAPPELAGTTAPPVASKAAGKRRGLTYMGSFMPYKNVELLLQALPLLPGYEVHLPSRISPARQSELMGPVAAADRQRVHFYNGASDVEYAKMLDQSLALVSASTSEGFGLPLIEAMVRGVPVACTDMPVFHEVGGKAALYFDPADPADLAGQVRRLEQPAVRAQAVQAGYEQAAKFSWDDSARALLAAMETLVGQRP